MATIEKGRKLITVVNVLTVSPEKQTELADLLAWIPMQKKKPNNSPDFLPYFGYNCVSIVVLLVYQYTVFHAVSPESSVIYNPEGKISQEKLENPAGFWNNVEENTFSLFQNKGAFE